MSKLAIFLSVVVCASAASQNHWNDALKNAKETLRTGHDKANKIHEVTKEKGQELATKLQTVALSYGKKCHVQIKDILDKSYAEINELTDKVDGIDFTDCKKFTASLNSTALGVISNMSSCVVAKLESASDCVDDIDRRYERVLQDLTNRRDDMHRCSPNVDNSEADDAAIACLNNATNLASSQVDSFSAAMDLKLAKLSYLIASLTLLPTSPPDIIHDLDPALEYCSTDHELVSINQEASVIVEKTKRCIQQKINDASE